MIYVCDKSLVDYLKSERENILRVSSRYSDFFYMCRICKIKHANRYGTICATKKKRERNSNQEKTNSNDDNEYDGGGNRQPTKMK